MSASRSIPIRSGHGREESVSNSFDVGSYASSTSPVAVRSPMASFAAKQLKPFHTQDIKVLLLENVNTIGQNMLKGQGYQVEAIKSSLPEAQLIEKIK